MDDARGQEAERRGLALHPGGGRAGQLCASLVNAPTAMSGRVVYQNGGSD